MAQARRFAQSAGGGGGGFASAGANVTTVEAVSRCAGTAPSEICTRIVRGPATPPEIVGVIDGNEPLSADDAAAAASGSYSGVPSSALWARWARPGVEGQRER